MCSTHWGFKVLHGGTHDKPRQVFLTKAERNVKANCQVQVQLRPEPTTENDKNAIGIDMNHGNRWFHWLYCQTTHRFIAYTN